MAKTLQLYEVKQYFIQTSLNDLPRSVWVPRRGNTQFQPLETHWWSCPQLTLELRTLLYLNISTLLSRTKTPISENHLQRKAFKICWHCLNQGDKFKWFIVIDRLVQTIILFIVNQTMFDKSIFLHSEYYRLGPEGILL